MTGKGHYLLTGRGGKGQKNLLISECIRKLDHIILGAGSNKKNYYLNKVHTDHSRRRQSETGDNTGQSGAHEGTKGCVLDQVRVKPERDEFWTFSTKRFIRTNESHLSP